MVRIPPEFRTRALATNPALLADVLLQQIYDAARPHCQPGLDPQRRIISCPHVDPNLDTATIARALQLLAGQQHIETAADNSSDLPGVVITASGAAHVVQSRAIMAHPISRRKTARDALLSWLYDHSSDPQGASNIYQIFGDHRSAVGGQFFSADDIDEAASYLEDKRLIGGSGVDGLRGPVIARITARGTDHYEDKITDYLQQSAKKRNPHPRRGQLNADYVTPNINVSFHGPVTGSALQIGSQNARQSVRNEVSDVDLMREFLAAYIARSDDLTLELSSNDAEQIRSELAAIESELENSSPDHKAIRARFHIVEDILANTAGGLAAAYLLELIHHIHW